MVAPWATQGEWGLGEPLPLVQRAGQGEHIASGEAELTLRGSQWAPWAQGTDSCPAPRGQMTSTTMAV